MAQLNNDLGMYRTATTTDDKKKKESPQEIKNRVAKKLFTEQEKRRTTDEPEGKLMRKVTKKWIGKGKETPQEQKQKATYDKEKKYRPQGDEMKKSGPSVFENLDNTTKQKRGGYKISQNPADYTPPESTEVNKQHRKKVNQILGKKK